MSVLEAMKSPGTRAFWTARIGRSSRLGALALPFARF
jgi:hypothetical protein